MRQLRVWELARETGLSSHGVLERLEALGVDATTHASSVSEADARRLRGLLAAERDGDQPAKVRVYELARSLRMDSAAVIDLLDQLGVDADSPIATVWTFDAERLIDWLEGRHARWGAGSLEHLTASHNGRPGREDRPPVATTDSVARSVTEPSGPAGGTEAPAPLGGTADAPSAAHPEQETPARTGWGLYRRILGQLEPHRKRIAGMAGLDLLATPLTLLTPIPVKIVVDSVLGDDPLPGFISAVTPSFLEATPFRLLVFAAVLQVLIVLASQLQSLGHYVLSTSTGEAITLGFRSRLFGHSQRLSLQFHDSRGVTDSLYRIEYDAPSLQHIVDTVLPFISSVVMLAATLYVTARIDPQLALIALAVAPVLFVLSRKHVGRLRDHYRLLKSLEMTAMGVVQEVLAAVRVVKAFGREDREQKRFLNRYGETVRARIELSLAEGNYGLLINVTTAVGTALVLFVGARNVLAGTTSLGNLLVVISYLAALYGPLEQIAERVGALQSSLASAERAFELLDELPEVEERARAKPLDAAEGRIEFRNVTFGYDPRHPVLRDVSFEIPQGARVGIVGRTGAGKTTLVSLMMRFYDPHEGEILLDGVDIRDYRLRDLRNQFAVMLQEPVLFSTSVAENIHYARPDAPHERIEEAARAAGAHDFVCELPDGYDTLVGERGMRLSGGERQRISLARAFLRDAPVLVLDEPTSSVDRDTEAQIMAAMDRLMEGRTTLMIAHRLSTLSRCDMLLEVRDGRVVRMTDTAMAEHLNEGIPA